MLTSKMIEEVWDIFIKLLLVLIFYAGVFFFVDRSANQHWLLEIVAIVFCGLALAIGLWELRLSQAKGYPVKKGVGILMLLVLIGAMFFGAISSLLMRAGLAQYQAVPPIDLILFNTFYLWLFFDMLPGLKVPETLSWPIPLQPVGVTAGLPVIGFRLFVLYGLFKGLKIWWDNREK